MKQSSNWLFVYEDKNNSKNWSTPSGFGKALKEINTKIIEYTFSNPKNVNLPNKKFIEEKNILVLLVFFAGKSLSLENELVRIKKETNVLIINELGDEPQTLVKNDVRAEISDLILTPDHRCNLYWKNQGYNSVWFNHWADTNIFYEIPNLTKNKFLISTMGRRKYNLFLKFFLGNQFTNMRCTPEKNAAFYSSGKIVFQYARWDEITRRIFEAAACNCCVLTNKLPSHTMIETLFVHNVSIIYYEGPFSLLKQLVRLKLKPNLARQIAKNARNLVLKNHTQLKRAETLVEIVNDILIKKDKIH